MESIKEILSSQHLFQSAVAVCFSECIRDDSVRKVTCFNRNIALWKDSAGCIRAVEDRCPHRGAPLSEGAVVGDYISCPYHGWQFDGTGLCNTKLRSSDEKSENYPSIISFQAIELFGLVWLLTDGFSTLEQLPHTNSDNFVYHFTDTIQAEAFLVMENLFDVNHFP